MNEVSVHRKPGWLRRWLIAPVIAQLTIGISPERLAWTVALGVVVGVFPVMGTTTIVCLLVGYIFRLNQPVMQVFKTVVYPFHLALILVFIHLGEKLFGAAQLSLSISQLVIKFEANPMQFARDFGIAAFHGVVAWAIVAPFAAILIKMAVRPGLSKLQLSLLENRKAVL